MRLYECARPRADTIDSDQTHFPPQLQGSKPPTRLHTLGHNSTPVPTGSILFLSGNQAIKGRGKDCCIVQLPRCYVT